MSARLRAVRETDIDQAAAAEPNLAHLGQQ